MGFSSSAETTPITAPFGPGLYRDCGWTPPPRRSALEGWRGGVLRADGVENASGSLLDVLQALGQQFGVTLVKLDVILRCRSCLKPDSLADDECYGLGFCLTAAL